MTLRAVLSTRVRPLAALTMAALALSACATTGGGGDTAADPDAPATLTIATSFAIDDLDPLENAFWGPEFGYVELLMRPTREGTPEPWVLSDLQNTDDTTWTLTLNQGVAFTDGAAFDAQALADLLTWTAENVDSFASASALATAEVTGQDQVTVTTSRPVPTLASVFADESMVPVFDVAGYEDYLAAGSDPTALVDAGLYTGPYVVQSLDDQAAELAPVADYWGGTPALSALTVKFVPEASSRVQAVQTGEADLALYMPTAIEQTLQGRDDAVWVTGEPTGSTFSLGFNTRSPGWDSPAVRTAALLAVDYRALAEDVLDGLADTATSVFAPSLPYAVDTQETDVDAAADQLEAAGWTLGADGTRTRDGVPLTLRLLSYPQQPDSTTLAEALQVQLGGVGIDVQVSQVDDITAAREGSDWDAAIVGASLVSFGGSPVEGLANGLVTGGSENYGGVSDPTLDDLVARLSVSFDDAERTDLLEQIQTVIADQGYVAATVLRLPAVVTNQAWSGYETPISNLWVTADTAPAAA